MPYVIDPEATFRDDQIVAFYQPSPLVVLPVVTNLCWYCQRMVDVTDRDSFTVSRVDGDSRHGYEPCHKACNEAITAEMADYSQDQSVAECDLCHNTRTTRIVTIACGSEAMGCDGVHIVCYACRR